MTNLEQAIRDAVEKGGYVYEDNAPNLSMYKWKVLMDAAFWQALGKARGWDAGDGQFYNCASGCGCKESDADMGPNNGNHSGAQCVFEPSRTLNEWHRLIDHLASGKDIESFFATL